MKKRTKRVLSILFELLIIIITYLSIILNNNYSIILNKKIINHEEDIDRYKSYRFVTLNLKNASESKFSIIDKSHDDTIVYTVNYGNKRCLVELLKSTVITEKVDVMIMADNEATSMLKDDLKEDNKTFTRGFYTNVNLKPNIDILKIKLSVSVLIVALCLILMFNDFINIIRKK